MEELAWQEAHQALLSVLCDAQVRLNKNLDILDPSAKFCHLVGLPSPHSHDVAHGRFSDIVAAEDLSRFQHFMDLHQGSTCTKHKRCDIAPPASIPIALVGTNGVSFGVEIFHVSLPSHDSNCIQHLFGIRELEPALREDASHRLEENKPTLSPSRKQQEIEAASRTCSSKSSSECSFEDHLATLERVDIVIDPCTPEFLMRSVQFTFESASTNLRQPKFIDWLLKRQNAEFTQWMQTAVNNVFHAQESVRYHKPLHIRIPMSRDIVLKASNVSSHVAHFLDASEVDCDLGDATNGYDAPLFATIQLRNLSLTILRRPLHGKHSSRSSGRRRTDQLPPVEETQPQLN